MFRYYIELAAQQIRLHPWLSVLITCQLAVGVAAFVATTQLHMAMARDPLPGKSEHTIHVQLDPRNSRYALDGIEPPPALTLRDAERLANLIPDTRETHTVGGTLKVLPAASGQSPFFTDARAVTKDFFAMFDVTFASGRPWGGDEDRRGERVAVISSAMANRLFADGNALGKLIQTQFGDYKVVGVESNWNPLPRFYDLGHKNTYTSEDQIFLPFSAVPHVDNGSWGDVDCWESEVDFTHLANQPCYWVQEWLQSPTLTEAQVTQRLVAFSEQERAEGRYQLAPNVRARNVTSWLSFNRAVPREVALEGWLAWVFFAVCLVNTMALLVAKFSRMSANLALRRALGASGKHVIGQLTVEAAAYGLLGGLLGAALSGPTAAIIRYQDLNYGNVGHSTTLLALTAFLVAVAGAVLAAVVPVWRNVQQSIHTQIKQR